MKIAFKVDVLKMEMSFTTKIEMEEPYDIYKVKSLIFEEFWQHFEKLSPIGKHGSPEHVLLRDRCQVPVDSTEDLIERIKECPNFEAVFVKHHYISGGIQV